MEVQHSASLDRAQLAAYLKTGFAGSREGSFERMWRRHAPTGPMLSGNWGYPGPKHKHSYEENPDAQKAIDALLVSDLGQIDSQDRVGRLVQGRFTLPKETVRMLAEWVLGRCLEKKETPGIIVAPDLAGRVKITLPDLALVMAEMPSPIREQLARTGGRTGLTVNLGKRLVWEYGLRIVMDLTGLKTVHSSGRQAESHS